MCHPERSLTRFCVKRSRRTCGSPMPPKISPPHTNLRDHPPARVSLPTTGDSIATTEVLNFQLAHAQARDAVHATLHLPSFAKRLHTELPILAEARIPI